MFPAALGALTSGLLALSLAAAPPAAQPAPPAPPGPPRPISQRVVIAPAPTNAPGRYFQHQPRANAYFSDTGLEVRLTPAKRPARKLGWGLVGGQSVVPQPLQPREARFHQLTVPDKVSQPGQPTWGALYYPEAAPGVDLWLESREAGVGYSLRAARGSQLARVWLEWRGAQGLRVAEGGRALEVQLADGHLREEGLRCGQERKDGSSYDVPCRYREVRATDTGSWQYLIEVDVKEPGRPAWVDPIIQWSTFIGTLSDETFDGIAVIKGGVTAGDIFIAGTSGDNDFDALLPISPGAKFGPGGFADVVVSRFGPQGELRWISVIGGVANDIGTSVAIGAGGVIYVAGATASPNLQTSGASLRGSSDGFIARLRSDNGSQLISFNYVGGSGDDFINGLTLGPDGKLYAVGGTSSPDMPGTTGGFDGGVDLFVSRFDPSVNLEKTLVRSGSNEELGYGITSGVQSDGGTGVYVTGYTESPNFPTSTGTPASSANRQAVILGLDSQLNTPAWSLLYGGSGRDEGYKLILVPDPAAGPGRVLVVGTTQSPDFPVIPFTQIPPGRNAFLLSFAANSGARSFATVIGGSGDDEGYAITQGTRGSVFVGGSTTSPTVAGSGGFDMTRENLEGYVIRLVPSGTEYVPEWGTFVGGNREDEVRVLDFSPQSDLLIGGVTRSTDALQGPEGPDITYSGRTDMFLYSLKGSDLTPPVRVQVLDGIGTDFDEQSSTTMLQASWEFQDPDSTITQYEVAAGTAPGCTNIAPFKSVQTNPSTTLTAPGQMTALTPGNWYYVTVRATNSLGLQTTESTNGIFVLFPDGGPSPLPPRTGTCPTGPDGGVPDGGGGPDGGADGGTPPGPGDGEGPESPLGWSCGTTGGPAGLVLLMLLALGVMGARRRS